MTRPADRATSSSRGLGALVPLDIDGVITVQPADPAPALQWPVTRRASPRSSDASRSRSPPRDGSGFSKTRTRPRSTPGRPRRSRPPSPAERLPGCFILAPSRSPPSFRRRWDSSGTSRDSSSPGSVPSATSRSREPRSMSRSRRACSTGSPAKRRRWPEPSTSTRLASRRGGRISRRSSARRSAATGEASSRTSRPRTPSGISSGESISTWRRTSRPRPSVRLSRHLHDPALGPGPATASAPRPSAQDPLRRPGRASILAGPRRPRRRGELPAQGPGGHRGYLPAPRVDAPRGPPLPPGRARLRGGRRHRPGARLVEKAIVPGGSR